MDLLITLLGNAVVDPNFRKMFLENPVDTADQYGFRLTKSDFELMLAVFGSPETSRKNEADHTFVALESAFVALENAFYARVPGRTCPRPCVMSLYPPSSLRARARQLSEERALAAKEENPAA